MSDVVILPAFGLVSTPKFCVISSKESLNYAQVYVYVDVNCSYSEAILKSAILRRPWCTLVTSIHDHDNTYQICDFENIDWENVLNNKTHASSYLIRKGLSRKAQFCQQVKKYTCKHEKSILREAIPYTVVVETWSAFEKLQLYFGGGTFASFDTSTSMQTPLRNRLEWCLEDVKDCMQSSCRSDWLWILKPSVTNKGIDISVIKNWEELLDCLEMSSDIREWVLQRYITSPLLVNGRKFHLRVYVLCVGALKVYVFDGILLLQAAHSYNEEDLLDMLCHLTNTAQAAKDANFVETECVKLLDDLPGILVREYPDMAPTRERGETIVRGIRKSIRDITSELFNAYENEYTVFCPMSNCFELYGLDFIVDMQLRVNLLEVNPGPDFKQTGNRLRRIIVDLMENMCSVVLDGEEEASSDSCVVADDAESGNDDAHLWNQKNKFVKVYDKIWSTASLNGAGMSLK